MSLHFDSEVLGQKSEKNIKSTGRSDSAVAIGTLSGPTSRTYTFSAGQYVGRIQVLGHFEPQDPSGANNETAYAWNALADVFDVKLKKSLEEIGKEENFVSEKTLKIEYEFDPSDANPPVSDYDWTIEVGTTSVSGMATE